MMETGGTTVQTKGDDLTVGKAAHPGLLRFRESGLLQSALLCALVVVLLLNVNSLRPSCYIRCENLSSKAV